MINKNSSILDNPKNSKFNSEDVAPGQIGIEEYFYQTGGEEFIGHTSDSKQSSVDYMNKYKEEI